MNKDFKNNFESKGASVSMLLHASSILLLSICSLLISGPLFNWLNKILPESSRDILEGIITIVVDAVLYLILYNLCFFVYNVIKFRFISPKMHMHGWWFHVHIPYDTAKKDDDVLIRDYLRVGKVLVKQNIYSMMVKGINHTAVFDRDNPELYFVKTGKGDRTVWSYAATNFVEEDVSDDAEVCDGELKICACFQADSGESRKSAGDTIAKKRFGVHDLTVKRIENNNLVSQENKEKKNNKYYVEGEYTDVFPSTNKGKILLFRDKLTRDEYVKKYFEKVLETKEKQEEKTK